jgi:hypothetical protein
MVIYRQSKATQGGKSMIGPTMSRRSLLAGGAMLAATPVTPALADWEPSQRYPDPAVEVLDPKFERLHIFDAGVERLATGMRWSEEPVWFGDGRYLLWSDIPNNRIMKFEEATGQISVFRQPSNNANGNCRDRQGRLISCEHLTRRVSRTEYDGSISVVCDRYDGKRLNSPNDATTHSDGSVWFTDPPFGIAGNYIGDLQEQELPPYVYRVDGATGRVTVVADDFVRPNGAGYAVVGMVAPHHCGEDLAELAVAARREAALHRRVARQPQPPDQGLRRGRQRQQARQRQGVRGCRPRHAGRLSLRHRRQPLVRLGHRPR